MGQNRRRVRMAEPCSGFALGCRVTIVDGLPDGAVESTARLTAFGPHP